MVLAGALEAVEAGAFPAVDAGLAGMFDRKLGNRGRSAEGSWGGGTEEMDDRQQEVRARVIYKPIVQSHVTMFTLVCPYGPRLTAAHQKNGPMHVTASWRALKGNDNDPQSALVNPLLRIHPLCSSPSLNHHLTLPTDSFLRCLEKSAESPSPESLLASTPPSPNNPDRPRLVSSSQSVVSTVS